MIQTSDDQIKKIVVLGGGSAGFLTAAAIAKKLPGVELVVVRSTRMGVIGVGEGTIPSVVTFLHRFLGLDLNDFNRRACPSIKLGIKYLWGKRPHFHYAFSPQCTHLHPWFHLPKGYFCQDNFDYADITSALMNFDKVALRQRNGKPRLNSSFAYHLENKKFVAYFEELGDELKVHKIDAIVKDVVKGPQGVDSLILDTGEVVKGDLFIDCSGFRAELIGKCLEEPYVPFDQALFCDRAVVGGWDRTEEDSYHPYTKAETMDAGWAWQIEHDELVNRGYVFCSGYLSDDEAVAEFVDKNPRIKNPRVIKFNAGVHKRTWVGNVIAAGFVEPIEATAIGIICDSISRLVRGLKASNLRILDIQRDIYNRIVFKNWEMIRDFIALHYKFNDRIETPFWKMCWNEVDLGGAQEIADYYRVVGPDLGFMNVELKSNLFTAEGYVAMLLGQRVEYERKVDLRPQVQQKWQDFKKRLATAASNGVSMEEYIQFLRNSDIKTFQANNETDEAESERVLDGADAGELNWH